MGESDLFSEESNQAVEEHLKECETCRAYFQAMKEAVASERYVERAERRSKKRFIHLKRLREKPGKEL